MDELFLEEQIALVIESLIKKVIDKMLLLKQPIYMSSFGDIYIDEIKGLVIEENIFKTIFESFSTHLYSPYPNNASVFVGSRPDSVVAMKYSTNNKNVTIEYLNFWGSLEVWTAVFKSLDQNRLKGPSVLPDNVLVLK